MTTRHTLTEYLTQSGHAVFADSGAVQTRDGRRPIKECSHCLGKVVFVQSKAGKWYLADVFAYGGESERYWYDKSAPHFRSCGHRAEFHREVLEEMESS